MSRASTEEVLATYSKYPYPSPTVGTSFSYDMANLFYLLVEDDGLDGKKVLDAGCGTGQRLMELLGLRLPAEQYGTAATQKEGDRSQLSIDADAFMHPIVNA